MLLNNLHAVRTNIQNLFSEMGGDKVQCVACVVLVTCSSV